MRIRTRLRAIALNALERVKPFGVISNGIDCDGMRGAETYLCWTRREAEETVDRIYEWAEGVTSAAVVSGRQAREFRANYEPDTRDRYAEQMGY